MSLGLKDLVTVGADINTVTVSVQLLFVSSISVIRFPGSALQTPDARGFTSAPAAVAVTVTGMVKEPPVGMVTALPAVQVSVLAATAQLMVPVAPPATASVPRT